MMDKPLFSVVILAGGLATRLRPLTDKIPKSLVEINGEPFIIHQLRLLIKQGVNNVVLCLGYLGEMVVEVLSNFTHDIHLNYCFDGPTLLGTAGAIKNALDQITTESFFVLYGDSYLPCDLTPIQNAYLSGQTKALMTIFHNEDRWDSSNVEFDGINILAYDKIKKNPRMNYIDYGLGILNKNAFGAIPDMKPYDLAELYQLLLVQRQLGAYTIKERFYEIGSLVGIAELSYYLRQYSSREHGCNLLSSSYQKSIESPTS